MMVFDGDIMRDIAIVMIAENRHTSGNSSEKQLVIVGKLCNCFKGKHFMGMFMMRMFFLLEK